MAEPAKKSDEGAEQPVLRDDAEIRTAIFEAVSRMEKLDDEAAALNAERSEIRAKLETLGINRHAFALVRRFYKLDEQQRDGFDLSMLICRRAVGLPMQSDLFGQ